MTKYQAIENATVEDVREGDRVTFRLYASPEMGEITAPVYAKDGELHVAGHMVGYSHAIIIIKVERPILDLPTKPGAVVRVGPTADFVRRDPNNWRGVRSGALYDDNFIRGALALDGRVLFEGADE